MSSEQERLAREWAESVRAMPAGHHDEYANAAAENILATTPPTMADVEWDDEKHRGAGATDPNGKVWVMSENDGGYINCTGLDMDTCGAPADTLTPNGKRYELREVTDEPEHPETLTTLEDYENAPKGTIVKLSEYDEPLRKHEQGRWEDPNGYKFTNERMAGISRTVKLWGLVK